MFEIRNVRVGAIVDVHREADHDIRIEGSRSERSRRGDHSRIRLLGRLSRARYLHMCFSASADVVGGVVIGVIGVDVLRHVNGRRHYMALAAVPLLLAVHQLNEAFVWWGLQGDVPSVVGKVATWIYLTIAFVVLPVYVPLAIFALEPPGRRRRAIVGFVVLGAAMAVVLLAAMLRGPVTATLASHYIGYSTDLRSGGLVVTLYVAATCGSLILSGIKDVVRFGLVNLIAVALLAWSTQEGFASLWCAWAAVCSAAFAIHLRRVKLTPPTQLPDFLWVGRS
jgi:hypothetical protein